MVKVFLLFIVLPVFSVLCTAQAHLDPIIADKNYQLKNFKIPKKGKPVVSQSTIQLVSCSSKGSERFHAGDKIKVIVRLHDQKNNPVKGFVLNDEMLSVPGMEKISESYWSEENEDGQYAISYIAQITGKNYKAGFRLSEWDKSIFSVPWEIIPGDAVPQVSTISADKRSYRNGEDIFITVVLADSFGNPVSGREDLLNNKTINISNAHRLSTHWQEKEKGVYSSVYQAKGNIEQIKAILKLEAWDTNVNFDSDTIN